MPRRLRQEPIDPKLTSIEDRLDYAERNIILWRQANTTVLAATQLSSEHVAWADERFGAGEGDFVITSPFDILCRRPSISATGTAFAREALYSWKPEHSAKFTVTKSQKAVLWVMLAVLIVTAAPMTTAVVAATTFTTIYTSTFLFKFVLTFVGSSRKADMEIGPDAVAQLKDADLPVYSVLVPMYKKAKVLPLTKALKGAIRN